MNAIETGHAIPIGIGNSENRQPQSYELSKAIEDIENRLETPIHQGCDGVYESFELISIPTFFFFSLLTFRNFRTHRPIDNYRDAAFFRWYFMSMIYRTSRNFGNISRVFSQHRTRTCLNQQQDRPVRSMRAQRLRGAPDKAACTTLVFRAIKTTSPA
ncbi:hypothetical protein [Burkholderia gladioli]|uniref:hypothetical protein n=1 Tax=Burkholderia gladioli TaxID=28095 RepID=UPI00163F6FA3|nr:hypothetical protein [Burkholderia gladioli]